MTKKPKTVVVYNVEGAVKVPDLRKAVGAVQKQLDREFAAAWNQTATLKFKNVKLGELEASLQAEDSVVVLLETMTDEIKKAAPSVEERPTVRVKDVKEKGKLPWSVGLSHVVLETVANPGGKLVVEGPHPTDAAKKALYSLVVCGPVRRSHYKIGPVAVSSFVTPAYFEMGAAKTTAHKVVVEPFKTAAGGRLEFKQTPGGELEDIPGNDTADIGFCNQNCK